MRPLRQAPGQRRLADSRLAEQQHARAGGKDWSPGRARAADEGQLPATGRTIPYGLISTRHRIGVYVTTTDARCGARRVQSSGSQPEERYRCGAPQRPWPSFLPPALTACSSPAPTSSSSVTAGSAVTQPGPPRRTRAQRQRRARGGDLARPLPAGHELRGIRPGRHSLGPGRRRPTATTARSASMDPRPRTCSRSRSGRTRTPPPPGGLVEGAGPRPAPAHEQAPRRDQPLGEHQGRLGLGDRAAVAARLGQRRWADDRVQRDLPAQGATSSASRTFSWATPRPARQRWRPKRRKALARGPSDVSPPGQASGAGGVALSRSASCLALAWA